MTFVKRKMLNLSSDQFRGVLCFVGFVVSIAIAGCAKRDKSVVALPAQSPSSHEQMLEILRDIAERTPDEHPYLGTHQVQLLRQRVANLGPSASVFDRIAAHSELGQEELHVDNIEAAIKHLTTASELFPQLPYPNETVRNRFWNRLTFSRGTAWMRLGETENCVQLYSSESCIVPIQGAGLHIRQIGSRTAIECFLEVLDRPSDEKVEQVKVHLPATWLLNIAYMTLGGYPHDVPKEHLIPPSFFQPEIDIRRFENISPKLGLDTFNLSGGAIVDDFDNDDYLDIMTSTHDSIGQTQLFRNNRDGAFTERTEEAGLLGLYGGLNMVQADYDNDGDVDVFIMRGAWLEEWGRHPNSLLRNDGGTFADVTFDAGLGKVHYPCKTAAWADYDNDGDLDLYVGNETTETCRAPAQLFRNRGNGTFEDVAAAAGLQEELFAMGATWGDYDGDRFPDLFVSNGGANRLYRNNRDGTFTDVAEEAGVTNPTASFPTWFWDFDNDGALDLYVGCSSGHVGILALNSLGADLTDIKTPTRQLQEEVEVEMMSLYRGDGRGGFMDVSREQKLTYPALPMGANFGDLNNDGYLDFYLGTGDIYYYELRPNVMFLNQAGQKFANVTTAGGFGHVQKGHGVSFADLDHDGDQDVYIQMGGAFLGDKFKDTLFENPGFDNHWITVQLVGQQSNRSAIGARIRAVIIEDGVERSVYRHVNSGGSFGCNPLRQSIGLGQATSIRKLEVYWPTTDQTQVFEDVPVNQIIRIIEGRSQYERLQLKELQF
ncbi:MAG: hypothetical protein CMJ50_09350 [Planctomycetaceae bacterium]|nr:hypothetical protein [Planctomycetaceae bacterium]